MLIISPFSVSKEGACWIHTQYLSYSFYSNTAISHVWFASLFTRFCTTPNRRESMRLHKKDIGCCALLMTIFQRLKLPCANFIYSLSLPFLSYRKPAALKFGRKSECNYTSDSCASLVKRHWLIMPLFSMNRPVCALVLFVLLKTSVVICILFMH